MWESNCFPGVFLTKIAEIIGMMRIMCWHKTCSLLSLKSVLGDTQPFSKLRGGNMDQAFTQSNRRFWSWAIFQSLRRRENPPCVDHYLEVFSSLKDS